ncbi:MAG: 4a-hydroxytetrahydrobiopterin dehydratase [Acidimicrobiales bacterium]|jgi:4a-hydroxytetrahydrobiopterin dehydratase
MARPPVLDPSALAAALDGPDAPAWELVGGRLMKTVACRSFPAALDFVMAVGRLAEEADHHPDIDIRWRTVTLSLVTHDAGGLTELDIALARAIDALPV